MRLNWSGVISRSQATCVAASIDLAGAGAVAQFSEVEDMMMMIFLVPTLDDILLNTLWK